MLKIYNTLTREKEIFNPLNKDKVNIYVCGITVYELCHIGHGRTFIAFDNIIRYLMYKGFKVNYIRNITDIDDKIINLLRNKKESLTQLTNRMISEMHLDLDNLNILRPNYEPRVTNYINEIIILIKILLEKNHAYIANNGDVMFIIKSYENYGILSKQNLKELKYNENIKNIIFKKNSKDFVLWKISKSYEPSWPSPWGNGRPGWHIECSAIVIKKLGYNFDIHGGGSDLIFPHHENEIAQSVCAYNCKYANTWIHTGMVIKNKDKMSKSLNNYLTIREMLMYQPYEVLRYFLSCSHYRSTINYCKYDFEQAYSVIKRLYSALYDTDINSKSMNGEDYIKKFNVAMDDDFNTPKAYAVLIELANEINNLKLKNSNNVSGLSATLYKLGKILGLFKTDPKSFLLRKVKNLNIKKIEYLIYLRNKARKYKYWNLADFIRNKLNNMGIKLEDGVSKTYWRYM